MLRNIQVISKKYDGTLRDEYVAYLCSETEETIIVFVPPDAHAFDHRKQAWFSGPDGVLEIYSRQKWYHVWHVCERLNSSTNKIYVHIAQPATFAEGVLRWTDMDMDFRVHADDTIALLDEDEFEQNAMRMGYPQFVIEQCWSACREVKAGLKSGDGLFDHEAQVELYRQIKKKLLK
jgi:protein associated with RNAse G/E